MAGAMSVLRRRDRDDSRDDQYDGLRLATRHREDCRWAMGGDGFSCTCGAWKDELRHAGSPAAAVGRKRTLWNRAMRHLYGRRR
jgi:hypothetical protein